MFKSRSIIALTLIVGFATVGCGAEDPYAGEDAEAIGEIDEAVLVGEYPPFQTYDGPVGGWVLYRQTVYQVLGIGSSIPYCPPGTHAERNAYGRWLCVAN